MSTQSSAVYALNLTVRPPRSMRCRLGGYVILPRMLDKCRATIAGTAGGYHFDCPLDQQFFSFVGIDPEALKNEVAKGGGDNDILSWIKQNAAIKRQPWEVEQWSAYQEQRAPELNTGAFEFFQETLSSHNPARGDVRSWADLLDLDDYCSFGGQG